MWKTSIRSLAAHRLRLILTVLAIALGVSFVVGTLVFTDSLNRSLEQLFDTEPADVVVQPVDEVSGGSGQPGGGPVTALTMPDSVIDDVADVDGVAAAVGSVNQVGVVVLNDEDKSVAGASSTPLGVSWEPDQETGQATVVDGEAPVGDDQVALDTTTSDKAGAGVGDTVRISTPLRTDSDKEWQVTAVVDVGLAGGATIVLFDLPTAQKYIVGAGRVNQILVTTQQGQDAATVAGNINDSLGSGYEAITGRQAADDQEGQITDSLGFLNTFLLVFALIAVFVSAFLIFNTFSMLVAQRTRELALLRAVGASREQVQAGVLIEATILGVLASTLGAVLGVGLALGLRQMFALLDIDMPGGALVISWRTILIAYAVGVLVTIVAAYFPARRASRVPPVAAMRADVTPTRASMLRRTSAGVAAWVLAGLLVVVGLGNGSETGIAIVGLGAVAGIVGTIALAPHVAKPALGVLGLPFRTTTGRLAVLNGKRDSRRTAATASALTIGVTLMSAMVIFSSSFTATADSAIDEVYGADFTIGTPPNYTAGFDHTLFGDLKDIDGVDAATYLRTTVGERNRGGGQGSASILVFGIDPAVFPEMVSVDVTDGNLSDIGAGKVAVDSRTAESFGWQVGDDAKATFRTGDESLQVVAIYEPVLVFTGFFTTVAAAEELGASDQLDNTVYLKVGESGDIEAVRGDVEDVLAGHPTVTAQDQAQIKQDVRAQIDQLLGMVFALLGLAIVIAVLGIANTLLLSIVERTRELGLLRAVGALPAQVRRMITIESLLLGVFGAVLGVGLGVLFGIAVQRSMEVVGLTTLAVPWTWLIVFVIAGAIAGMLASIWPAITASKLNILRAIATE